MSNQCWTQFNNTDWKGTEVYRFRDFGSRPGLYVRTMLTSFTLQIIYK